MPQEIDQELQNKRHSLAHLLGAAIKEIYGNDANLAIGPAIDDGFYYDFELPTSTVLDDNAVKKIEKKMRTLLPTWDIFARREVSEDEAKSNYLENPYKSEIIEEIIKKGESITFYTSGKFTDLCRGGHAESMKNIDPESFKLTTVAGAYWRGDEKNKMLTRIYGLAFNTKEELEEYERLQKEAAERDHKKLGKELGLFVFSETVGKGLPLLTPKGATIRRELERFTVDEELRRGYLHVYTPDIANLDLYKKSGHYPYYKDSMYAPIKIDDDEYMLRPMTCPHHFELYLAEPHSYRELPMRIAEMAHLYRYEQSGELMGLLRVRTFTLADAHIITRKPQAENELSEVLDLIDYICSSVGLTLGTDYRYRLSLGDRSDDGKYYKDDASWEFAEGVLRKVLQARKADYYEAEKEAAFYGPKIDVQMKNVNGKEDTAFTVQYDFVMPKRFGLTYKNEQGTDEEPVVIHRSSIGCIERIMAFLIEKYAGAFPLWLSPVQVKVLPISDNQLKYAEQVIKDLRLQIPDLRLELDSRSESIGKKIREAAKEKVPYMVIIGAKEQEASTISIRGRGDADLGSMSVQEFAEKIKDEIENKK